MGRVWRAVVGPRRGSTLRAGGRALGFLARARARRPPQGHGPPHPGDPRERGRPASERPRRRLLRRLARRVRWTRRPAAVEPGARVPLRATRLVARRPPSRARCGARPLLPPASDRRGGGGDDDPGGAVAAPAVAPRVPRPDPVPGRPARASSARRSLEALERAGYERVDAVTEVGQWSLRGGIVDVFSPTHERPVRAEFFGDEVESLRVFDPTSQRSVEPVKELAVLPLVGDARRDRGVDRLPAGRRARGARGPRPARRASRRRAVGRATRHAPRGLPAIGASTPGGTDVGRDAGHHGHALRGRLPGPVQGRWPPRSADGAGRASPCGSWWTTSGRRSASGACCPSTSSRPGRA